MPLCNQCAAEHHASPGDFANRGLYPSQLVWVECRDESTGRGCGTTLVDTWGNCVSTSCLKRHYCERDPEGLPFVVVPRPTASERFVHQALIVSAALGWLLGLACGYAVWAV